MRGPSARAATVLVMLALLGWHVHARRKPDAALSAPDRLLLQATGPLQRGLHGVTQAVGRLGSGYVALVGVADENEQLKSDLAAARTAAAELRELRGQNDRLRNLLDLRTRQPSESVAATVVGRGTSRRFRTLRIDRGSDDGVIKGMAVVALDGAVGQVLRTSGDYADVLLLRDGLAAAGAMVQESRLRGVVHGGEDTLRMGYVRWSDSGGIKPGDPVVSSGEDGVFPPGVPLGTVASAEPPQTGLFLDIVLEPAVDVERLDEVLVLVDAGRGPYSGAGDRLDHLALPPAGPLEAPSQDLPGPWLELQAPALPAEEGDAPAGEPAPVESVAPGSPWGPSPELDRLGELLPPDPEDGPADGWSPREPR